MCAHIIFQLINLFNIQKFTEKHRLQSQEEDA